MIGKIISHYEILEKLGAGGMGIVYKARDTTLGRTVALKFLPPYATDSEEDRIRFLNEAQAAASLDHPNLCAIHEISEADGHHFIAMAFIDGQSLREIVSAGPLATGRAVDIAQQIAAGLAAAHAHGIIHRDIKPANILVGKNGVVKIVDFGLAKSSISKKLTRTGSTIGTAAYMSPEQARGEPVDHRTDIWSLGAVLYEMLTGQPPYIGAHEAVVIYSILNEDFTPLDRLRPEIPAGLRHVVGRALSKDLGKRYAGINEMIADLRQFEDIVPTRPHPIPSAPPPRAVPAKRRPVYLWSAIGALVLAAVAVWIALRPAGIQTPATIPATGASAAESTRTDSALPTTAPQALPSTPAADSIVPSIAILPFENLPGGKDDESFAAGVAADLITDLSNLRSVRALPRQEIMPYQGRTAAARTIGKALNADYVMAGTVRREQGKLHLTTQMIKVADGSSIWEERFDRDLKDLFQVRGEIVRGITSALSIKLSASERRALVVAPTSNMDAYGYYLKGRLAFDRCDRDDNDEAEKMFRKATSLDKNYALAQIGLAQTYLQRVECNIDPDPKWVEAATALLDKAAIDTTQADLYLGYTTLHRIRGATSRSIAAARRAVSLRPNDHEVHFALAVSLYNAQKWDEADRELTKTLDLRPDFAEPYLFRARIAAFSGKPLLADSQLNKALELAPRAAPVHLEVAQQLLRRGRFADAESEVRQAMELAPQAPVYVAFLGTVELWQQQSEQAVDHLKETVDKLRSAESYRQLGWAYRTIGKKGPAEKAFRNSLRLDKEKLDLDSTNTSLAFQVLADQCLLDPKSAFEPELNRLAKKTFRTNDPTERAYLIAIVCCAVGNIDRAVASLREVLKYNTVAPSYIASNPAFAAIKDDPKFRELVGQR